MLDLETLGTDSNSVVVSISAVIFDMQTGKIGNTFEIGLDTYAQEKNGGITDEETLAWWAKQNQAAKDELARLIKVPVDEALSEFNIFIKKNFTAPSKIKLWGNGATFDNVILRNLYKRHNVNFVVPYYADKDVRTFTYLEKVNTRAYEFVGVKHRGIDDCKHQIKYCTDTYINNRKQNHAN